MRISDCSSDVCSSDLFGRAFTQGIGDGLPLLMGLLRCFLREDRLDHGDDGSPLLGGNMGERIAHPMYPAALLGCMEDFAGSGAKPFVVVCDDKFDAPEPAIGQRAQEALQAGFSLGWAGTNAQYRSETRRGGEEWV